MHLHLNFSQPLIRTNIINTQVYLKHSSKLSVKAALASPVVVLHVHFQNTKTFQALTNVEEISACIPEWSF